MNICVQAAEASNQFEKNNTELKKNYLIKNIEIINSLMERVPGYYGSFGTGYPFYVLDNNFEGDLPFISEQIRYNNELLEEGKKLDSQWVCATCLSTKGHSMPDLKQICKPCPQITDLLKPRKVINRLPDIDMWMVCSDGEVESATNRLSDLFESFDMHTSDVNPVRTIQDISEISKDLDNGKMPSKMLPLDIHVVEYSKLSNLIEEVPFELQSALKNERAPFLPIHPISLRKTWQYDDVAYNFILDFLFSMTPISIEKNLNDKINYSREIISKAFTNKQLFEVLHSVSSDSNERRLETPQLQKTYERRMNLWRK